MEVFFGEFAHMSGRSYTRHPGNSYQIVKDLNPVQRDHCWVISIRYFVSNPTIRFPKITIANIKLGSTVCYQMILLNPSALAAGLLIDDIRPAFLYYFAALAKETNNNCGAKMKFTDLLIFAILFVVAYAIYKTLDKKMRP
ncbi:MAG: hypothetical protein PVH28_06350 [Desulfobacterales bacterium]|jgi:hypothetical protein